jgi:hypothetical protein
VLDPFHDRSVSQGKSRQGQGAHLNKIHTPRCRLRISSTVFGSSRSRTLRFFSIKRAAWPLSWSHRSCSARPGHARVDFSQLNAPPRRTQSSRTCSCPRKSMPFLLSCHGAAASPTPTDIFGVWTRRQHAPSGILGPSGAVQYSTVQIFSDRIRGATVKHALILLVLLMG